MLANKSLAFFYCLFFILLGCKNEKPSFNYLNSPLVKDYIPLFGAPKELLEAEKLKWDQNFSQAIIAYENRLKQQIPISESFYVINQIIYCNLWLGEFKIAQSYISHLEKQGIHLSPVLDELKAELYFNKGKYFKEIGDGENAIKWLKKSVPALSKINPPNHIKIVQAQCELGESYRLFTPQIDSFIHYTNLAFQSIEAHPILERHAHQVYLNKANTFRFSRDYANGFAFADRALMLMNQLPFEDKIFEAKCHHTKSHMLKKMQKRKEAEYEIKKAVEIGESISPAHEQLQTFYNDLILIYASKKDSANFFKMYERLAERFDVDSMRFANADRLKGFYYFIKNDFEKAKSYYLKTLVQLENNPYSDVQMLDETFFMLTTIFEREGSYEEAIHFVIRNLIRGTDLKVEEVSWERLQSMEFAKKRNRFVGYNQLGGIYLRSYKNDKSRIDHLEKAFESLLVVDKLIFKNESVIEEDALLKYLQEVGESAYANAIQCGYYLFLEKEDPKYLDWINVFMERTKFSLLFRDLLSKEKTAFPEVPDSLRMKEQQLIATLSEIKSKLGTDPKLNSTFNSLSKKQKDLYQTFKAHYPRYYEAKVNQKIPTIASLQDLVKTTHQPIIQFHLGEREDFIFAITADSIALLKLERDQTINQHLQNYRSVLDTFSFDHLENTKGMFLESSFEVFQKYIQPILPILKKSKNWVIIPSGRLGLIPFESLLTEKVENKAGANFKNLPYLVNDFSIQYAHSVKTYFRNQSQVFEINKKSKILAYAYSDGSTDPKRYDDIRGTYDELQFLEKQFSSAKNHFRYGKKSSKVDFLKQCEREFDILHLALHGDSDFSNKLNNKIIFNSSHITDSTASLYGYEIVPLQINAQLIILSACETAFGKIMEAEGAYTITRAFLQAGAKNIISTLWSVEDFSNAEIIPAFYKQMLQGETPQEALTLAKRLFIKNADELTAHPFFWAGVICYEG